MRTASTATMRTVQIHRQLWSPPPGLGELPPPGRAPAGGSRPIGPDGTHRPMLGAAIRDGYRPRAPEARSTGSPARYSHAATTDRGPSRTRRGPMSPGPRQYRSAMPSSGDDEVRADARPRRAPIGAARARVEGASRLPGEPAARRPGHAGATPAGGSSSPCVGFAGRPDRRPSSSITVAAGVTGQRPRQLSAIAQPGGPAGLVHRLGPGRAVDRVLLGPAGRPAGCEGRAAWSPTSGCRFRLDRPAGESSSASAGSCSSRCSTCPSSPDLHDFNAPDDQADRRGARARASR